MIFCLIRASTVKIKTDSLRGYERQRALWFPVTEIYIISTSLLINRHTIASRNSSSFSPPSILETTASLLFDEEQKRSDANYLPVSHRLFVLFFLRNCFVNSHLFLVISSVGNLYKPSAWGRNEGGKWGYKKKIQMLTPSCINAFRWRPRKREV